MKTMSWHLVGVIAALCASRALAQDVARIRLPESDLVSARQPYVIDVTFLERTNAVNGTVTLELRRAEPGLVSRATTCMVDLTVPAPAGAPVATNGPGVQLVIHAGALAEGEYTGALTLAVGARRQTQAIAFFRMTESSGPGIPFAMYAIPFPKSVAGQLAMLQDLKDAGLNVICQHMSGMRGYTQIMDRAARFGLQFMPSVNTSYPPTRTDDMYIRFADGTFTPKWRYVCLNNPAVRKYAAATLTKEMAEYRAHPAFSGRIYYGDDMNLPGGSNGMISCYCDYCRADFKQLTGYAAPERCEPKKGIVDTNDLALLWMRYRCDNNYGGFVRAMEQARQAFDPGIAIGLIHGWSEQPFTQVACGIYPPFTQGFGVVSSYCYPMLRSPRMDFIGQYEIAKMGNRAKDVWMLGMLGMFSTVRAPEEICQSYWDMLAAGYKSIGWFQWFDLQTTNEPERVRAAAAALGRCGRAKDWVLPAAAYWTQPAASNAVLYSFTTEAFDVFSEHRLAHLKKVLWLYREALRTGTPLRIISEEEIRAGMLKDLASLSLFDVRAIPADVHKLIEEYASTGGKVYVDYETGTPFKGAEQASLETMVAFVRDRSGGPARIADRDVTLRDFTCGQARYYVFVNNFTDHYYGLGFNYTNRLANYAQMTLVRNAPIHTTVEFAPPLHWLFDLSTGASAGTTDQPLRLDLEPSWGRVLVALDSKSATLKVTGERRARAGTAVVYHLAILDDKERVLDGAFTVRVTVTTPTGRTSRYSTYLGVVKGAGDFVLPLGANDETGTWRLTFEGGFPRTARTMKLYVSEGPALESILSVASAEPALK